MSRPLKIQLPDTTLLRIDQDEWKVLACPIHVRPHGDKKRIIDQLFVRQHPDGRVLVYVVLERPGELATMAGELLPQVGAEAESAVGRIIKRFSLPESIANECIAAISNQRLS